MDRGPEGEPRVSGRVESPAPRPDTATPRHPWAGDALTTFFCECAIAFCVLAVCILVTPWLASLV